MPFLTFTKFRVATDDPLPSIIDESELHPPAHPPKNWIPILRPLMKAPGQEGSMWGPIREMPDTILLLSEWKDQESYEVFLQSEGYKNVYWPALSRIATPILHTVPYPWICILRQILYNDNYLTILTCYFLAPISAEQRGRLDRRGFRGIEPKWVNRSLGQPNPNKEWHHLPEKLWSTTLERRDDKEMEALLWLHFWKDEENEDNFMQKQLRKHQTATDPKNFITMEALEENLKAENCQAITKEHINMLQIALGDPWIPPSQPMH